MSSSQSRRQPTDSLVGRVVNDRFRVLELLARGGMGRVYRAEQVPLGRLVALKVLDRPAGDDGEFETRFLNEASTAAKLQHSNTVTVFDYGRTDDGVCFIAMELVEGISLRDAIRKGAPFSPQRTVHVALQIARSLREAHKLDVIHRDLKPANVLLTRHDDDSDFVKVLDFGLVKHVDNDDKEGLTREGLFLGSPKYMAPEHILGDRVDARADIYSLGVCMYEMLTGNVPFAHDSTVKILMAHMHEQAPSLRSASVPAALSDLVARCLAKAAADRPSSMDEMILELKRTIGSDSLHSGSYAIPLDALSRARLDANSPSAGSGFRLPSLPPSALVERPAPAAVAPSVHRALVPPVAALDTGATAAAAPRRGPKYARLAVVCLLVLVGAGFGLSGVRSKTEVVTGTATQEAHASSTVKMLAAPPAEASLAAGTEASVGEAAHIFVRLNSNPSGAMVTFEGRSYGPTPANVEIEGPGVSRGSEVTFVFEKEGYEPVRITRIVKLQNLTLETDLTRPSNDGRARSRPIASAPRTPAPAPVAAPAPAPAVLSTSAPAAVPQARPAVAAAPVVQAPAVQAPVAPVAPAPAAPAREVVATIASASKPLPGGPDTVPEYPRAARRAGITGVVVARVHVQPNGIVKSVEIMDGPSVFHESVRTALASRRYQPARLSTGAAVADSHVVRVPFELK